MNEKYLEETKLLDYKCNTIQKLISDRKFNELDDYNKIKSIYNYVKDEILFGYNSSDSISSSEVLSDGYGQCNTKAILLMSLLRGCNIKCRIHGFYIDKKLQKGAMTNLVYILSPRKIFHSWVEVFYNDNWYVLEGVILDNKYLNSIKNKFKDCTGKFIGYGIATNDFQNIDTTWNECNTYIQSDGIVKDLGIYDSPDELYKEYDQNMSKLKEMLYKNIGRHLMNKNISKLRNKR